MNQCRNVGIQLADGSGKFVWHRAQGTEYQGVSV